MGLAIAVAALVYFGLRPGDAIEPSGLRAPTSAAPLEAPRRPEAAAVAAGTPKQPAALVAEPRPELVAPATVQQLLPSVQRAVTNWKEFKPQKITIAPYPDMPIEFEATSIREESGRTVWTGRNAIQGAFLVAAATETDWQATLVIPPAGAFDIHISGEAVTMLEKNHDDELCGTRPAMIPHAAADVVGSAPDSAPTGAITAADSTTTVDVLFFYDATTLAAQPQNDPANFETRMIAHLASSNVALENSGIANFRWRYLASYQVPAYTATNDMTDDLYLITGRTGNNTPMPSAVNDFVTAKAVAHGADQVVLYVAGPRNYAGIAWVAVDSPASLPLAFHSSVVAWGTSYMALAHELGHNFGCHHDRDTEAASDSDGHFYYGHRFLDRSGRDTGTIMSYAISRLPYFSNPTVTFDGYVLGVLETQPRAANNSRVIRESAPAMIASRLAIDPPAITSQPQSVTVIVGQNFSLSVTATGSNLAYQWKLAGADIVGASGAVYSKSAAATDAGSYTVTVSNVVGQVTSAAVTVTVADNTAPSSGTSTPPVAPPPAASGGGGGGGGAPSLWFYGVLSLLVATRFIVRRRLSA